MLLQLTCQEYDSICIHAFHALSAPGMLHGMTHSRVALELISYVVGKHCTLSRACLVEIVQQVNE